MIRSSFPANDNSARQHNFAGLDNNRPNKDSLDNTKDRANSLCYRSTLESNDLIIYEAIYDK